MPDMTPMSLAAIVTPRTYKIIINGLNVFEEENICDYTFVFKLGQSSDIVLQRDEKQTFLKGAWHLKG